MVNKNKNKDLLLPFCFNKKFQNRIFHFQELESTMDKAKILAKNGAPHLSVVIAENQTMGRGRLHRKWFSSKGGLWFTIILKPETPPSLSYIYNFAASLSLAKSLRQLFDIKVYVKWPNDILLNGKKLTGILSEMATSGDMVEYINIGIGINVNNTPQKYEQKAIALKDVLQNKVSRNKVSKKLISRKLILKTFLNNFENQIQEIECDEIECEKIECEKIKHGKIKCEKIIKQWKKMTSTIGSQVRIETTKDTFKGLAIDVDSTGALIIKDKNQEIKKIVYGDCFHT